MRKVELRMNEQEKYEVIKKLVGTKGGVKRAALKLDCSVRTIYNHIRGYKETGKEHFVHGNCGRKPVHTIATEEKERLIHWKRIRKPTYQPDLYRSNQKKSTMPFRKKSLIFMNLMHEGHAVSTSANSSKWTPRRTLGLDLIKPPFMWPLMCVYAKLKAPKNSKRIPGKQTGKSPKKAGHIETISQMKYPLSKA